MTEVDAISMATHSHTPSTAVTHLGVSPTKVTPPRKAVYSRDDSMEFPATKVDERSTVKLRVCNFLHLQVHHNW